MKRLFLTFTLAATFLPFAVSAYTCPSLYRSLQIGMSGDDVRQLQVFLIETGDLAAGNAIGIFGQRTRAAVRSFQCREMQICSGSETTTGWGRVGPATRAKIQQVCGGTAYAQGAYYAQGSYSDQSKLTATPRSGNAPLSVTFTMQGKAHQWSDPNNPGVIAAVSDLGSQYIDFGDGSANFQVVCVNATGPTCVVNTTHTYARAGTYTARLVEYGGYCREPCPHVPVASVTITVNSGSNSASLSASPPSGAAPLSVTFTARGTLTGRPGEDSIRIDFGDGTTAAMPIECYYGEQGCVPRATHTYTNAGTYTAKVIAYDPRKDCAWNSTPDELHPDCASTVVAKTVVTVSSGTVGFGARLDVQSSVNGSVVTLSITPVEVGYCNSNGDTASIDWGDGSATVNTPGYGIGYLWGRPCSGNSGTFTVTHDYDPNTNSAMLRKDVTINITLNGYSKSLTLRVGDYDPVN